MHTEFSVLAAAVNMFYVAFFIGVVAMLTHRWSHKDLGQEAIPCQNHGGYWADLLVLSPVFGFIAPCWTGIWWLGAVASLVITIGCHLLWVADNDELMPCHFLKKSRHFWQFWQRFTLPGAPIHAVYMFVAMTAILSFYWSPGHQAAKIWVSILLGVLYLPIGVLQPNWYYHKVRREASITLLRGCDEDSLFDYEYHEDRANRDKEEWFDVPTALLFVVLESLIVSANFVF